MKLKLCEIVQQAEYITVEAIANGMEKGGVKDFAYILHDKDEGVAPHYHIALRLKYAYDTKYVAEWFGVSENYVGKVNGRWSDMMQYLTHKNAPEKFQYDDHEVVSNFDWKNARVAVTLDKIIQDISDGEIREYNQTEKIDAITYSKYSARIKSAFEYRRLKVMLDQNRDIQVMFFEGDTGVGKTSLAKLFAQKIGNGSVFVSGSSNDPMQGYGGQDTIIFDDMRDDSFTYTDLLKVLDNHTGSAIRSRYSNKVFTGKCIMITSYRPIRDWYQGVPEEARGQLFRRITFINKIDKDTVRSFEIDDEGNEHFQAAIKNPITLMHDISKATTIDQWKGLMLDVIASIDVSDDIKKKIADSMSTENPFDILDDGFNELDGQEKLPF